ncbi:Putative CBL-interacting protein kinase family protein isoform 1 [Zea mays]|uniref:Putative CBL-interacting protein kinase family protein isoform 1 n=1 Tax=Zea mays TaxID=4577 RepID=A0A1D6QH09_MAIZE|nr:Putative CBL-interacting protein kinase family protein isoform 1 [Zea mays]
MLLSRTSERRNGKLFCAPSFQANYSACNGGCPGNCAGAPPSLYMLRLELLAVAEGKFIQ